MEAAAATKRERAVRKALTVWGLFGRWSASLRWDGRRPVGPGEECEGKVRMSLRMVSLLRPWGKGL